MDAVLATIQQGAASARPSEVGVFFHCKGIDNSATSMVPNRPSFETIRKRLSKRPSTLYSVCDLHFDSEILSISYQICG